jgi:VWFA-related protein
MRLSRLHLSSALVLATSLLFTAKLPAQAPNPSAPEPLRVFAREVVLDVNVADAKGVPVHGLTKGNFTVLEDGQPISPSGFREHRSDENAPGVAMPSLPPNTFTNAGQPEGVRPLNILLLDSLNTPIVTQSVVRKHLLDFVDKLPPGMPVAVFGLSATGELSLVQGFTTDPDLLRKGIKSKKLDLQVPPLEDFGQESTDSSQSQPVTTPVTRTGRVIRTPTVKVNLDMECNHVEARGEYTFTALTQIARYVSGMPGRKNLIWYTGLFPIAMKDKQGGECVDFREDTRVVGERLGHSHIVLYPVDPRALDILAREGPDSRIGRLVTVEDTRMEGLADNSGGKAFYNNNDLTAAALQAVEAGSNYYTITYTPTNQNLDSRQRTISVNVDQPNLTLVYRHNYHATPPGQTVSGQVIQKATPLQTSMLRGALEPSEIVFHVAVAPAAAPDTALPPGNTADPALMKPPFRHLTLSYNIDISGIQFDPSQDGAYHGQFDYAVNVYDPDSGKLLNQSIMAAKPALPLAVYQSMLASGVKIRQEIDVPATREYVLRIGVHDLTSDRVGAIEIPVSAIHP